MAVTPFLLLSRSAAEGLAARTRTAIDRWAATWTGIPQTTVTSTTANDQADVVLTLPDWNRRTLANGTSLWIHVPGRFNRFIEQLLFGLANADSGADGHLTSDIATSIANEALDELLEGLVAEVTGQTSQAAPPASISTRLVRPGSGAVLCTVALGDRAIRLLLPAESIPRSATPTKRPDCPAITDLKRALESTPLALSIEVCRAELTLGHLRTLAIGDVLALPIGLDHPLAVVDADGTPVCHAHLGSLSGFHAVELVRPTA